MMLQSVLTSIRQISSCSYEIGKCVQNDHDLADVYNFIKLFKCKKTALCDAVECAYIDKKDFELFL